MNEIEQLKAENTAIKTSYINFVARLKAEMITKEDIQDLKNTVKKFVEERNSLILENEQLKAENERLKEEILKWQTAYSRQYQINENKGYNKKEEQYRQTLQEIKAIAETCTSCGDCGCAINQMSHILDLITKAEEE